MKNQKKLFENIGGHQFKLITESITETIQGSELVREGLKKIFANGSKEISYQRIAGVGTGYIKDITTARKCALQESRDLAPSYGYIPNDNEQKFVKEEDEEMSDYDRERYENETSPEEPEGNQEESREIQIAKEIKRLSSPDLGNTGMTGQVEKNVASRISTLCDELIQMHEKSNDDSIKNKSLSGWDTLQLGSH